MGERCKCLVASKTRVRKGRLLRTSREETRRAAPSGAALGTRAFWRLDALARASGTTAALRQRDRDGGRLQGCLALDEIELGGRGAANQRSRPCEVVVRDEVEARQSAGARNARKRLFGGLEARPRQAARGALAESLENVSLHNQSRSRLPGSVTYRHGRGALQAADLESRGAHRRAYEMHAAERPADVAEATRQSAQPVVAHRARAEQRARHHQPTDRVHNAMPRLQGQIDHAALAESQPSPRRNIRRTRGEQGRGRLRELHRRYPGVGLIEPQVVIVRVTWAQGRAYFDTRASCVVVSRPRRFSGLRRAIQRVVDSWRGREAEAPKIGEGWRRVAGSEAPLRHRRGGRLDRL